MEISRIKKEAGSKSLKVLKNIKLTSRAAEKEEQRTTLNLRRRQESKVQ